MQTATLLSPYGLDGTLKAVFFSHNTGHISVGDSFKAVLRSGASVLLTLDGFKKAKTESFDAYLHFSGYDTKEKATSLSNAALYVPRAKASPLNEGEVYTADLIGMEVLVEGEKEGKVVSIVDMSNGVLLEIERGDKKKFLVPYNGVFIGDVNLGENTLVLLKKELLDL